MKPSVCFVLSNVVHWEQLARASGRFEVAMSDHVVGCEAVCRFQMCYQTFDSCQLFSRGWFFFKVAYQGDSNSVLIMFAVSRMGTVHLFAPAKRGLNFAISHAVAVANYKVITNS